MYQFIVDLWQAWNEARIGYVNRYRKHRLGSQSLTLGFFLFQILNKTEIQTSYDTDIQHWYEREYLMNKNLTKYLSDVFRNEVPSKDMREPLESNIQSSQHLVDRNINQFIVDKKFSLRLDEII